MTDAAGAERQILKGVDGYLEPNHMLVRRGGVGGWVQTVSLLSGCAHGRAAAVHAPHRWLLAALLALTGPLPAGHHGPQRLRQDDAAG